MFYVLRFKFRQVFGALLVRRSTASAKEIHLGYNGQRYLLLKGAKLSSKLVAACRRISQDFAGHCVCKIVEDNGFFGGAGSVPRGQAGSGRVEVLGRQ